MRRRPVVEIGKNNGGIALYLDYEDAWAVADAFPYPDRAGQEMIAAIHKAYPERLHKDKLCDPENCIICDEDNEAEV